MNFPILEDVVIKHIPRERIFQTYKWRGYNVFRILVHIYR